MIFTTKMTTTDKSLSEELVTNGWSKIKEPKNMFTAISASIPFMLLNTVLTIWIILHFYKPLETVIASGSISMTINLLQLLFFIVASFVLILVHELTHMLLIPNFIKSDKTCWGITLNGGFVATTEKISKLRFIMISIMPYFSLSVILPIILGACSILNNYIVALIISMRWLHLWIF